MAFTVLEQGDYHRPPSSRTYYRIVAACVVFCGVGFGVGWFANSSSPPEAKAAVGSDEQRSTARPLFIFYGDSITQYGSDVSTQGWAAQIQQTYVRSVDVINRGLSSYNTKTFLQNAVPTFRRELASVFAPTLITLWLGTNDATLDGPNMIRHVPIDQYQANLVNIVSQFRELAPNAKILVITPGVVDDDARRRAQADWGWPSDLPQHLTNERMGQYAEACVNATKSMASGVELLDLHTALMDKYPNATSRAALLVDGLHLSKEGNNAVFEEINSEIKTLLPGSLLSTSQIG